jgi:hypothetical protein
MKAPVSPRPERPTQFEAPIAEVKTRAAEEKKEGMVGKFSGMAVSLFAGLVGVALSKAFGALFWFPVLLVVACWFVGKWGGVPEEVRPVLSTSGGHFLWIAASLLILLNQGRLGEANWISLYVEMPLNIALLGWVAWKRSRLSLAILMVYQAVVLVTNVVSLDGATQSQAGFLVVHAIMRIVELGCGVYAIVKIGKAKRAVVALAGK